jgi:hypothetical protein
VLRTIAFASKARLCRDDDDDDATSREAESGSRVRKKEPASMHTMPSILVPSAVHTSSRDASSARMVPRARLFGRDARLSAARALVAWLLASSLALARALAPHPHRRLDVRPTALREHLTRGRAVGPGGFRSASAGFPGDAPKERWVTQPLDHFDPTDVVAADARSSGRGDDDAWDAARRKETHSRETHARSAPAGRTWRQRWFANDAFFDRTRFRSPNDARSRYERASDLPDPVVFLCVGGEGPGFDADVVVTGGPHCASAVGLARSLFLKKKAARSSWRSNTGSTASRNPPAS